MGEPLVDRGVVAGNVYDKYDTNNPIARRLVQGFLAGLDALVNVSGCTEVHEVGCGEGELAIRLASRGLTVSASDISSRVIELARKRAHAAAAEIRFEVADIEALAPSRHAAPLVLCCEVLEHVPTPTRALDQLHRLASPYLIASVPREPLWRILNLARGRYLRALGNTPGHLNHWSRPAFLSLLETRFEVLETRAPLPWTMALCRKR